MDRARRERSDPLVGHDAGRSASRRATPPASPRRPRAGCQGGRDRSASERSISRDVEVDDVQAAGPAARGRPHGAEHTSRMSDLFADAARERMQEVAPLALRLRPRSLDEFVGQEQVLGERSALRLAIAEDRVGSAILYGPPGTGKTTLARIVAETTGAAFEELSAVSATVEGRARGARAGARAARRQRAADDPLPRRDPPLQQGPAGRAPAGGRGGARDADRRDDREPVLRGQLGAALALSRSTSCEPLGEEELRTIVARGAEALEAEVPGRRRRRSSRGAPAATRATR